MERVKREKEELFLRFNYASKENNELQNILKEENNIDKVNKYMKDDLIYEKDRNH